MQVDTVRCSNCNSQILEKCFMIHERACQKKINWQTLNLQKPGNSIFSQIVSANKIQQKQDGAMIPCTQCGDSVPFSIFAVHQEQCVGHQLMKCDQCQILFPTFLFEQHLQVCTGPKYQLPSQNSLYNIFQRSQPQIEVKPSNNLFCHKLSLINSPEKKVQKMMIPQDDESDDEELVQMIGQLAKREIQNYKSSEKPLTGQQLRKLYQVKLKSGDECSICCCEMIQNNNHVRLNCSHLFHKKCIFSWLAKNPLCPMCRQHPLKQ